MTDKITIEIPAPPPKDAPPVEGWVRQSGYWLAPIEWTPDPMYAGEAVYVEHGVTYTGHRCVGFLRLDELEEYKRGYRGDQDMRPPPIDAATKPYPCLLDWQATHAVMKKEGE